MNLKLDIAPIILDQYRGQKIKVWLLAFGVAIHGRHFPNVILQIIVPCHGLYIYKEWSTLMRIFGRLQAYRKKKE